MTHNHPVQVGRRGGRHVFSEVVKAGDIEPGVHTIRSSQGVELVVSEVQRCNAPSTTSVSLTMYQGQRHAVLVGPTQSPVSSGTCFA
eukprot:CAMPEP_0180652614 /NCGR_PEP_ID=MMETSP1037_2-20121125/53588_1 /TAXON_ID=632150 /ORGANISM="Azadinium spinosum, Strain 3D9" /LENGTH=86 /DNA_ID=CAMNT_0022678493 /DNA_START=246 /DNA_END=503 /DNA_ORIENTATION=-